MRTLAEDAAKAVTDAGQAHDRYLELSLKPAVELTPKPVQDHFASSGVGTEANPGPTKSPKTAEAMRPAGDATTTASPPGQE